MESYGWPGNVRELEHMIERGVIITTGTSLKMTDQLVPSLHGDSKDKPLKDMAAAEREHILRVLQETGWRIEGPSGAALILKLHPNTLRSRIKKLASAARITSFSKSVRPYNEISLNHDISLCGRASFPCPPYFSTVKTLIIPNLYMLSSPPIHCGTLLG